MAVERIARWCIGKFFKLPPAAAGRLCKTADMPVLMRDGVTLLADRLYKESPENAPVVLIRSCYGRGQIFGIMVVRYKVLRFYGSIYSLSVFVPKLRLSGLI